MSNPHGSDTQHSRAKSHRLRAFLGGLTLGTVLMAIVGLLAIDSVREDICEWSVPKAGRNLPGCGAQFELVSADEASPYLRHFYASAGGAAPKTTWDEMLSSEAQARTSQERFVEIWEPYLYAELIGSAIEADKFNSFTVIVRMYDKDGRVDRRRKEVTLRVVDETIKVYEDRQGRVVDSDDEDGYQEVVVVEADHTYHQASRTGDIAMKKKDHNVGGTLIALCFLDRDGTDDDWIRTPQGWLHASSGHIDDPDTVLSCDPRQ